MEINNAKENVFFDCFKTFFEQIQQDSSKINKTFNQNKNNKNITLTNNSLYNLDSHVKTRNNPQIKKEKRISDSIANSLSNFEYIHSNKRFIQQENSQNNILKENNENNNQNSPILKEFKTINERRIMGKLNSNNKNEGYLKKVTAFHKKHIPFNFNEPPEIKEIPLENENESNKNEKNDSFNNFKRKQEAYEFTGVSSNEELSKKMKFL